MHSHSQDSRSEYVFSLLGSIKVLIESERSKYEFKNLEHLAQCIATVTAQCTHPEEMFLMSVAGSPFPI